MATSISALLAFWASSTPSKRAELLKRLSVADKEALLTQLEGHAAFRRAWKPQPKQQIAQDLASTTFETLFGGAAFGGKTWMISNYAVMHCLDSPGTVVAIVRKNLNDLERTHGRNLRHITADIPGVRYNGQSHIWKFANGSEIWFISLPHVGSEQDYKSVQFDILLFDEVTELPEDQYTYMVQTRVRSGGQSKVRAHVLAASNPEGVGYPWLKRRFVQPKPGDLGPGQEAPQPFEVWNPPLHNGKPGRSRVFVPATIYDNPAGMAADPEYIISLEGLADSRKRNALLHGDWNAMDQVPGALWDLTNIDEHRVAHAPDLARSIVCIDPAGTRGPNSDETGIVGCGQDLRGHAYVLADRSGKYAPGGWARAAIMLAIEIGAGAVGIETSGSAGEALLKVLSDEMDAMVAEGFLHMALDIIEVKATGATGGKNTRAEPIAALSRKGFIHHVGTLAELEEQLTTWLPTSGYSPDRLDAFVWCLWVLSGRVPAAKKGFAMTR